MSYGFTVCVAVCLMVTSFYLEVAFCRTHSFCRIYILFAGYMPQRHLDVFCSHLSACLYRTKSSTLPAELFLDDRHTLPPSVWIVLSTPFRLDFVCPIFRLAFYRSKLLRSLFLWQSCFSMVGILRHLRELFCSHLLDWIFLSVAFIDRDYYALCFFGRVASR